MDRGVSKITSYGRNECLPVSFETIPIWVQVWGLPFDLINEEAGRDIGRGIGRVIEIDCKAIAADQAKFLRIRVDMPLDKPIRPKVCSASIVREGEELPYRDWLRAWFRRQKEQSIKEAPNPPRRQPTDHQPPRTTDSPVVAPTGSITSMERDINEGVTDSIMALTTQNSHGMVKQTVMENINLDFMVEITPGVMREINSDNKELPNGKELNRKEKKRGSAC
nr:hypothetical protein CFP56_25644 [Quercus suber]